ncbi:hypothetical protein ACUOFC_43625, partial [Escherichia sp. TWPC-MK]
IDCRLVYPAISSVNNRLYDFSVATLYVIGDRATVEVMNLHQTYEVATENLEILFFTEDMAG